MYSSQNAVLPVSRRCSRHLGAARRSRSPCRLLADRRSVGISYSYFRRATLPPLPPPSRMTAGGSGNWAVALVYSQAGARKTSASSGTISKMSYQENPKFAIPILSRKYKDPKQSHSIHLYEISPVQALSHVACICHAPTVLINGQVF